MAEGGAPIPASTTNPSLPTNVKDITKCSRCKHQIQDPKTLQCLHSFCSQCLAGIDKSEKDGATGYECPECQAFTPEKEVAVYPLLVELLDAQLLSRSGTNALKCEPCGKKERKWYCSECKKNNWMCDECKEHHDKFLDHNVKALLDMKDVIPDKPAYCIIHPEYRVVGYCSQCENTICGVCKMNEHGDHQTVPYEDAIERIPRQMKTDLEKVTQMIMTEQSTLTKLEKEKEEIITRFNTQIRQEENRINQHRQVVAWISTAITKSKGVALLQHLGFGLSDKLKHAVEQHVNCTLSRIQASRNWPWKNTSDEPQLTKTISLVNGSQYPYTRISMVFDRIWVINHNTCTVYTFDLNGTNTGEIQLNEFTNKPRTAVQVTSDRVVIAAKSGLCCLDRNGKLLTKLNYGNFADALFGLDNMLYALEFDKGILVRYVLTGDEFRKLNDVRLHGYAGDNTDCGHNYVNTFAIKDQSIYVCIVGNHNIMQYDLAGRFIKVISHSLKHPSISGLSSDGFLLLSSLDGRYVAWLDHSGNRQNILSVKYAPFFTLWQNANSFWILDYSSAEVKQYTFNKQ